MWIDADDELNPHSSSAIRKAIRRWSGRAFYVKIRLKRVTRSKNVTSLESSLREGIYSLRE